MIMLNIHYNTRTERRTTETLWGANLIAINTMRLDPRINSIDLVDTTTGEVHRTYARG